MSTNNIYRNDIKAGNVCLLRSFNNVIGKEVYTEKTFKSALKEIAKKKGWKRTINYYYDGFYQDLLDFEGSSIKVVLYEGNKDIGNPLGCIITTLGHATGYKYHSESDSWYKLEYKTTIKLKKDDIISRLNGAQGVSLLFYE